MLRSLLLGIVFIGLITGCKSFAKIQTVDTDDVYLDPKKDKEVFYPKEEEIKPATETAKVAEPAAKTEEDNNPYYKEKDFKYDDYYDYEYASRLRRFNNPVYGVGYYDTYYTNTYFYNYNPYQYNVSIYNGYSCWGPTTTIVQTYYGGGWNNGWGNNNGWNNGFGGWNNGWGYNNGWNNGWGNYYGYNGWNNGWNNGWGNNGWGNGWGNNGWGNGWNNNYAGNGYYNPYDANSGSYHYGPRTTSSGGNSKAVTSPKNDGKKIATPNTNLNSPVKSGVEATDITRFNQVTIPVKNNHSLGNEGIVKPTKNPGYVAPTTSPTYNNGVNNSPELVKPTKKAPLNETPITTTPPKSGKPTLISPKNNEQPVKNENQGKPNYNNDTPKQNYSPPKSNSGGSSPSNSSPRSTGGNSGGGKPRK